ncbi:MAG: hypothetical protein ISS36_00050 [Candidatus Aenigmarchaeota archaeon]|nr:hypothetical protein [Candidatus Aenigmarchaeota archaeon]
MERTFEAPICRIKVKGNSEQTSMNKSILDLDGNNIVLVRSPRENIYWTTKVSSRRYTNYIYLTSNLKQRPSEIEIIKIAKICEKPAYKQTQKNQMDILDFTENSWTCIERYQGHITIYKPPKGPNITIKRIIKVDKELAWSIGFYLAEGNKCSYGIGITNHELNLLKLFQDSLKKYFSIQKKDWFIYIHSLNKNSFGKLKTELISIFQTSKIGSVKSKLATKDTTELRINNTLFAIIFNRFISKATKLILKEKSLTLAFLKGYEVGDGCVLQRNGYLYGICITVKNNNIKNILVSSLQKLYKIKPRIRKTKGCYEIICTGVNLMTEFILDKHFYSSLRQWKKLKSSYLKKQYTRSHIRYWNVLKNRELLTKEIAKITKRSHWSVLDAMNKDAKFRLVKIKQKRFRNKHGLHYVFSLTERGNELLNLLGGTDEEN